MRGIINTAELVGQDLFGSSGRLWFPRLQMQYHLACLRRHSYDDVPFRVRQHLLLLATKGLVKSTSSSYFLTHIVGTQRMGQAPLGSTARPVVVTMNKGTSLERLRGGANEAGRPIEPLFRIGHYYYAPEMFSFLGRNPAQYREKADYMNIVLEDHEIEVSLNKMRNGKAKKEDLEKLEALDVEYDTETSTMRYQVKGSFLACATPPEPKVLADLEDCGFLSRLQVSAWTPSDEERVGMVTNGSDPRHRNVVAEKALILHNRKAWRTQFEVLNAPPKDFIDRVAVIMADEARKLKEELGTPLEETLNMRVRLEAVQTITAAATMRVVRALDLDEDALVALETRDEFHVIPSLEYREEDVGWAIEWTRFRAAERYAELAARPQIDSSEGPDRAIFCAFVETLEGDVEDPPVYRLADLVKWVSENKGLHRGSAYAWHNKVRRRGWTSIATNVAATQSGPGRKSGVFRPSDDVLRVTHPHIAEAEEERARMQAMMQEVG